MKLFYIYVTRVVKDVHSLFRIKLAAASLIFAQKAFLSSIAHGHRMEQHLPLPPLRSEFGSSMTTASAWQLSG